VSPAKTAKSTKMQLGLRTWVGPGNEVQIPPWEGTILRREKGRPIGKYGKPSMWGGDAA